MAITLVQSAAITNNTVSTLAFGSNNTAGNLLIAVGRLVNTGSSTTISDSAGNSNWALLQSFLNLGAADQNLCFWYAPNCKGSANTVQFPTGYAFYEGIIAEYSGVAISSPTDQQNSNSTTSSVATLQPGSITPSQNGELIVTWSANNNANSTTQTINSGFSLVSTNSFGNVYFAHILGGTTSPINPTWDCTSQNLTDWGVGIVSFFAAGSGGQGNSPIGNVIIDLDSDGFPILEVQTGTNA